MNYIDKSKFNFEWVQANCPARLDLAGAWSDTPPITYECTGGSCVTNVSILVNGRKPIGSKAKVIKSSEQHCVHIVMKDYEHDDESGQIVLKFTRLDEFRDYNKPHALACLIKAVCVFTKLVELNDDLSLSEQLEKKINGSLMVQTWTGVPHGSGLGTSSILIGCVLKVIWYLMGIDVSNETLSYSIIIIEQLMTTSRVNRILNLFQRKLKIFILFSL